MANKINNKSVLENILGDSSASGLYELSKDLELPFIKSLAANKGFKFLFFDGTLIQNRDDFTHVAGPLIECPYGADGLNEFLDCLRDLEWFTEDGFVILFKDSQILQQAVPDDFEMVRDDLEMAASDWKRAGPKPMYIFLQ